MSNDIISCITCSYYIIDEDIQNLDRSQQIEFEKIDFKSIHDNEDIDLVKLANLLNGLRRKTCIGGLIKENEIRKNCKYYKTLSYDFDKNQLLQSFIANSNKIYSRKSMITTIVIAFLTISATLFGISQSSKNRGLKKEIDKYILLEKEVVYSNNIKFKELTDSINRLNLIINNKNLKNE